MILGELGVADAACMEYSMYMLYVLCLIMPEERILSNDIYLLTAFLCRNVSHCLLVLCAYRIYFTAPLCHFDVTCSRVYDNSVGVKSVGESSRMLCQH